MDLKINNETSVLLEQDLRTIFFGFMKKSAICKNRIEKLGDTIHVDIVTGKFGDEATNSGEKVILTTSGKTNKASINITRLAEDLFFEIGNVINTTNYKNIRKLFYNGRLSLREVGIEKSMCEANQMWTYFQGLKDLNSNNVDLSEKALKHLNKHGSQSEQGYKASFMTSKQSNEPNAPAFKKLSSPDCYSYTILNETSVSKIRAILRRKVVGAGAVEFKKLLDNFNFFDLKIRENQPVYWCITKMIYLDPRLTIPQGYYFSFQMENLVKKVVINNKEAKDFFGDAMENYWGLRHVIPTGWWS